ncbi:hypothetical protein chiPu_0017704 [Chiloscyllium punctatum]|uniref:Uncharacterized protein n=1 Tax=Chiloscyllium punctatum TaxID=137246 RepID=A0A401RID1_CHIPU|nr:hypothetical protein [Chiloscyllium punctatum]
MSPASSSPRDRGSAYTGSLSRARLNCSSGSRAQSGGWERKLHDCSWREGSKEQRQVGLSHCCWWDLAVRQGFAHGQRPLALEPRIRNPMSASCLP